MEHNIKQLEQLEQYIQQFVDDQVGLDTALGCLHVRANKDIEIYVSFHKQLRKYPPTRETSSAIEWKYCAEELIENLQKDYGEFEIQGWDNNGFRIYQELKTF